MFQRCQVAKLDKRIKKIRLFSSHSLLFSSYKMNEKRFKCMKEAMKNLINAISKKLQHFFAAVKKN